MEDNPIYRKQNLLKPHIGGIHNFYRNNYCFFIGIYNRHRNAYKYMDLETAMLCIKNGSIRFAQPDTWADRYEGRFYNANYSNVIVDAESAPKLYACCITFTNVSEAAWNMYTYNKSGIGSRCVQFKFNRSLFRSELERYAKSDKKNIFKIYEGKVQYNYSDFQIDNLHKKESDLYSLFFDDFSLEKYLNLLLIKRMAFRYEEEFRFFAIPENQNKIAPYIDIPICWQNVLEEIRIDERCTPVEIEAFEYFCSKYNIQKPIIPFKLHDNPQPNIVIE